MTSDNRDSLGERIAKAKAVREGKTRPRRAAETSSNTAGAMALRYGAEFGASVFVGIMIGLVIDHYAGTEPWGLLVMLGFGLAAGVRNVIVAYRRLTSSAHEADAGDGDARS